MPAPPSVPADSLDPAEMEGFLQEILQWEEGELTKLIRLDPEILEAVDEIEEATVVASIIQKVDLAVDVENEIPNFDVDMRRLETPPMLQIFRSMMIKAVLSRAVEGPVRIPKGMGTLPPRYIRPRRRAPRYLCVNRPGYLSRSPNL